MVEPFLRLQLANVFLLLVLVIGFGPLATRSEAQTTVRIVPDASQASGGSDFRAMSSDWRFVVFASSANLVPGATKGGLYVRDLLTLVPSSFWGLAVQSSPSARTGALSRSLLLPPT